MMKPALIVFLVLCAFAIAMVPRDRRALNTEDEHWYQNGNSKSTGRTQQICARTTPCFWSVYRPVSKNIELNITNTYCICSSDMVCKMTEDDTTVSAYIYRCRLPSEEGLTIES